MAEDYLLALGLLIAGAVVLLIFILGTIQFLNLFL